MEVECGPADKSQGCSECAGGRGGAGVKVAVVKDFVKSILYTVKVWEVDVKPILALLS